MINPHVPAKVIGLLTPLELCACLPTKAPLTFPPQNNPILSSNFLGFLYNFNKNMQN